MNPKIGLRTRRKNEISSAKNEAFGNSAVTSSVQYWHGEEDARTMPRKRGKMRKVYVPLTVLGLGGLGWLFLTERGRTALRWMGDSLPIGPERLLEWNQTAQRELDGVQVALNRVAESLQAAQ